MPVDKTELLLKSLEKRVNDVEKHIQKAPAGDPNLVVKRVNELEKAVAQLKEGLAGKKDQKSEEQRLEKKAIKIINDLHLEQKLKIMEAKFDSELIKLRMQLRGLGAHV